MVRDLPEIRRLLERKLAWYGLPATAVGTFRPTGQGTLRCELLTADGSPLARICVDRRTGAVRIDRDGRWRDGLIALSVAISAATLAEAPPQRWHPVAGPHPTD